MLHLLDVVNMLSIVSAIANVMSCSKLMHLDDLGEMLKRSWYLGLTSFGGPAVHFQIVCIRTQRLKLAADGGTVSSIVRREVQMDR